MCQLGKLAMQFFQVLIYVFIFVCVEEIREQLAGGGSFLSLCGSPGIKLKVIRLGDPLSHFANCSNAILFV